MAKRTRSSRRGKREQERETNWLIIGGIIVVGAVGLFALLFLTLQAQDSPSPTEAPQGQSLAKYCAENPDNCVTKGLNDAPVTIVEVSDYGCGHCKNFNLETAGLLDDLYVTPGQVRWIVLPYALYPQTAPAASAAMCAADQDRFFEYHRRLFESQGEPQFMTTAGFLQVAEDSGLDLEAFEGCLEGGIHDNTVQQNIQAALQAGVRSTPTFFVNEIMLRGNQPLPAFQRQINAIIGAGDAS